MIPRKNKKENILWGEKGYTNAGSFKKGQVPWNKNKPCSKKTKKKLSVTQKRNWENPEYRKNIVAKAKAYYNIPGIRAYRGSLRRQYFLNNNYFAEPLDAARVYWLGFLIADGNTNGGNQCVSISLKDRGLLVKFKEAIGYTGHIYHYTKHREHWRLEFRATKMINDLAKFGVVPRKSFKTYVPKQIPKNLLRHFYRGLFDGDGSIGHSKSGWFLNLVGTKSVCDSFKKWTNDQTKNNTGGVYPKASVFCVRFCGKESPFKIAKLLYEGVSEEIRLERKYQKYLEFKNFVGKEENNERKN